MPSPFPGMDPYLEGWLWPTIHSQLISEYARALAPLVAPRYTAFTSESVLIDEVEEADLRNRYRAIPDVSVERVREASVQYSAGAAAGMPIRVETLLADPHRQLSIEIRSVGERRLVTALELLSPANKRGSGRLQYLAK